MKKSSFVLPDSRDVRGVVSDYFDALESNFDTCIEREEVITSCEKPFLLLINAWEMVEAGGSAEKRIWIEFMQDITVSKQLPVS